MSRTNIVIDDALIEKAMALSGISTKRETVTKALLEFVQRREQKSLLDLEGKIHFHDGYDYLSLRKGHRNDPR